MNTDVRRMNQRAAGSCPSKSTRQWHSEEPGHFHSPQKKSTKCHRAVCCSRAPVWAGDVVHKTSRKVSLNSENRDISPFSTCSCRVHGPTCPSSGLRRPTATRGEPCGGGAGKAHTAAAWPRGASFSGAASQLSTQSARSTFCLEQHVNSLKRNSET